MASYTLTVPGPLQPKERPRLGKNGHTYTPRATVEQEYLIRRAWQDRVGRPLEGPLALELHVFRPRPALHHRRNGELSAAGARSAYPTGRPDLDNYLKVVLDGLQEVAWHDDAQVVGIVARKHWSTTAKWAVTVEEMSDG